MLNNINNIINCSFVFRKNNFWKDYRPRFLLKPFNVFLFKKKNCMHTRIVKLKFLASRLSNHIALFNMLFEMNPNICFPSSVASVHVLGTHRNSVAVIQDIVMVAVINIQLTSIQPFKLLTPSIYFVNIPAWQWIKITRNRHFKIRSKKSWQPKHLLFRRTRL